MSPARYFATISPASSTAEAVGESRGDLGEGAAQARPEIHGLPDGVVRFEGEQDPADDVVDVDEIAGLGSVLEDERSCPSSSRDEKIAATPV